MKNQLFRIIPDKKITLKLLSFFGIHNFEDNHSFTKDLLIEFNTLENFNNIIKELENYYLPCKYKIYLRNLNEKKCITILRQFLKFMIIPFSKEKYKNGKKLLFYQVIVNKLIFKILKK